MYWIKQYLVKKKRCARRRMFRDMPPYPRRWIAALTGVDDPEKPACARAAYFFAPPVAALPSPGFCFATTLSLIPL
jgi:hypothetical protein